MSDCCAAAQREVAYLLGECDKATMEIDLLRAAVRRQTMADLARQVPLAHERIALLDQLAIGGRLVIPVGAGETQELLLIVREEDGYSRHVLDLVRFVPLLNGPLA